MDQNTQKPLISINICTFNRANLISKAIESALAQNYRNIEIIIVDDNSNDNTEEVVNYFISSNPNIFFYKNSVNLGITKNRNIALENSKGKYIAVLDSDDYWINENKLSEQVEFLENNPEFAVIGTFTKIVDSNDNEIGILKPEITDALIRKKILMQNQFTHSSVLFKKDCLKEYDKRNFTPVEDYAAWLEIGKKYKFANLPKIYTAYKKHGANISQLQKIKGAKTLSRLIKEYNNYYPNSFKASIKNTIRLLRSVL